MNAAQIQALENLADVVRSEVYSGFRISQPDGGKWVKTLEGRFSALYNHEAISCSSASVGLYLALRALDVGFGDRVLVPAYTMSACAAAVVMCGATPVWVDVHPRNGLMTTDTIADAHNWVIDNGDQPPVAAIFVNVHGYCYNVSGWKGAYPNLKIIEDCAQSFLNWEPDIKELAGTGADAAVFSFKQGKLLSCGEGGMVLSHAPETTAKLQRLRNHGEVLDRDILGFNFHMTELQAAVACAYLEQAKEQMTRRALYTQELDKRLAHLHGWNAMNLRSGAPFIYWVLAQDVNQAGPEGFTRGYHKPLCCLPWYKHNIRQGCQLNAHLFNSAIYWTKPPESEQDVDRIAAAVLKAAPV